MSRSYYNYEWESGMGSGMLGEWDIALDGYRARFNGYDLLITREKLSRFHSTGCPIIPQVILHETEEQDTIKSKIKKACSYVEKKVKVILNRSIKPTVEEPINIKTKKNIVPITNEEVTFIPYKHYRGTYLRNFTSELSQ